MTPVDAVLDLLGSRPATLGSGQLLCIDGPAGSGKSTFAPVVADRVPGSRLLHMDDLFEGWAGLPTVDVQLEALLRPLSDDAMGSYRRYDWFDAARAETVEVHPSPLLVIEGVGCGASRFADLRTVLVWVEAPYDERLRRGLARDGDAFAPHWKQWATDEAELFARERTRERADLVVDGTRSYEGSS